MNMKNQNSHADIVKNPSRKMENPTQREGNIMRKHGIRSLLLVLLLVTTLGVAYSLELYNQDPAMEIGTIETKTMIQEEVVSIDTYEIMTVLSVEISKQQPVGEIIIIKYFPLVAINTIGEPRGGILLPAGNS